MGRVARSVLAGGGRVTGIIPKFLIKHENALLNAQELIVVDDMHQRKQMMFDRADAFVALPGGIGTLEELVEQLTWVQLARHRKPVLLADIGGFWRPLLALIAHMHNLGFLREGFDVHYLVAEKIEDVLPMLAGGGRARRRFRRLSRTRTALPLDALWRQGDEGKAARRGAWGRRRHDAGAG